MLARLVLILKAGLLVAGSRDVPQAGATRRHLLQANNDAPNQNSTAPATPPPPSPYIWSSPNTTEELDREWSLGQAVLRLNLAGRQRMYSQKLAKDALLIHLGVDVDTALWQMEETRQKFAEISEAFKYGSEMLFVDPMTSPELLAQLDVILQIWKPFNQVLKNTAGRGNITLQETLVIASLEEPLLAELDTFVRMIEAENLSDYDDGAAQSADYALQLSAINQASAQRMRTQKMMVKYAMCVAGIDYEKSLAAMRATDKQFENVHKGLLYGSSELNLPAPEDSRVLLWLGRVSIIWEGKKGFYALMEAEPNLFRLPDLVKLNIALLGRYNVVVGLMKRSSTSPPSPKAPPSYPMYPPLATDSKGLEGALLIVVILASCVGAICMCSLAYCCIRSSRGSVQEKEAVHNPFTTGIKLADDGSENPK